ncbi:MAG: hypothetical protein WCG06_02150, partial [Candidatus Omnitrophota bacterium]
MPHHFVFDPQRFLGISTLMAVIFACARARASKRPGEAPEDDLKKRAMVLSVVIFLAGLAQYADYYFFKWGFVARMQFLRLSCLIGLVGIISLSAVIVREASPSCRRKRFSSGIRSTAVTMTALWNGCGRRRTARRTRWRRRSRHC